eukprot:354084-Chlamydomonas_euryale.AAC.1
MYGSAVGEKSNFLGLAVQPFSPTRMAFYALLSQVAACVASAPALRGLCVPPPPRAQPVGLQSVCAGRGTLLRCV